MSDTKLTGSGRAGGTRAGELAAALAGQTPLLQRAAGLSLAISLLSLASTVYMLAVYDRVLASRSLTTLLMLTLAAVGAYLMLELLEWVRAEIMTAAANRFEIALSERVFDAIFVADLRREVQAPQQAVHDLRSLRDLIAAPVVTAVMDTPMALFLLIVMFLISPVLGLAALIGGALQALIAFLTGRYSQPPLVQANKAALAAQTYAGEVMRNAQVIEAMGMLPAIRERWLARQREFFARQGAAADMAGGLLAASRFLQLTQFSALLGLGCWLFLQGQLSGGAGVVTVAAILGGRFLQPLVQTATAWRSLIQGRDAWQRLTALLQQVPRREAGMSLPPLRGALRVENVVAGAPGSRAPILRGVSFELPAGEALAIIGPSAAGKTTLARLLVGVWPTLAGEVRLDGAALFHGNRAEFGRQIGYLPQTVQLFEGSLADNIARFGPVDRVAVDAAIRQVGLARWVASLPEGLETRLGDDGNRLSGGLRQRVGLARALYGGPRFVVLDEPNSSLDQDGENALIDTLRQLKASGVTVVVITHRQGLLAAVDRLLLLNEGVVQACGPRDQVLATLGQPRPASPPVAPSPSPSPSPIPA